MVSGLLGDVGLGVGLGGPGLGLWPASERAERVRTTVMVVIMLFLEAVAAVFDRKCVRGAVIVVSAAVRKREVFTSRSERVDVACDSDVMVMASDVPKGSSCVIVTVAVMLTIPVSLNSEKHPHHVHKH